MSFNGTEGQLIELDEAVGMTTAFRNAYPETTRAVFMGKDILQELLDQDGAMGIRCYFAVENGVLTLAMVAADASEEDMTDKVANKGDKCPGDNACATASPLYSPD